MIDDLSVVNESIFYFSLSISLFYSNYYPLVVVTSFSSLYLCVWGPHGHARCVLSIVEEVMMVMMMPQLRFRSARGGPSFHIFLCFMTIRTRDNTNRMTHIKTRYLLPTPPTNAAREKERAR